MFALGQITPILRIFDESKAKEFYLDFLEFTLDWEHRFEDDLPLYMQISNGACTLQLSGHHGDGCPGVHLRIGADSIETLHQRLLSKKYKHARPGLEATPWGTRECTVWDPFGNRLTFYEPRPV